VITFAFALIMLYLCLTENFDEYDSAEEDTLEDEFRHHKRHYYMSKMDY